MAHFFRTGKERKNALSKKTEDLLNELSTVATVQDYLSGNAGEFIPKDFFGYLREYTERAGISKGEVAKRSGIDRFYIYDIYRGRKLPTADKIVCIALTLGLNLEETQHLLMTASRPVLYAKRKRDSILIFAVNNQKSVMETNMLLFEAGEPLLSE